MFSNLVSTIQHSRAWQRIESEALTEIESERQSAHAQCAHELTAVREQRDRDLQMAEPRHEQALADYQRAVKAMNAAAKKLNAAAFEVQNIRTIAAQQATTLERQLEASSDPRIDEALARCEAQITAVRNRAPIMSIGEKVTEGRFGEAIKRTIELGTEETDAVLRALYRLRDQLRALKLRGVDDVAEAIAELEARVP